MKVKKAQVGIKAVAKKKAAVDSVPSEMFPGKMIPKSAVRKGAYITESKKKMKDGGKSFPDLNKDGKITKADILKGRGVIKNGGKLKKAKSGASLSPSKKNVSSELGGYKKVIGKNYGKAKAGAKVAKKMMGGGKCKYGC